jgi:gamma-glutamylcysteine synthetase
MVTQKGANGKGARGLGVDIYGGQVVDPTANVIALTEAEAKRQDDLREANEKLQKSENTRLEAYVAHAEFIGDLRAKHQKEFADARDRHILEMRTAEAARLDSIRQVDVTAVKTEADRAQAAIATLAATTSTNAENLRNALNATAATIAKSTSDTFAQVTERLAALEKASYESVGKQRIADPMIAELTAEVKALREVGQQTTGTKTGVSKTLGAIVGAIGLFLTCIMIIQVLITIGFAAYAFTRPAQPIIKPPIEISTPK